MKASTLALLALTWACLGGGAASAAEPVLSPSSTVLSNRVYAGVWVDVAPEVGRSAVKLQLGERLRWTAVQHDRFRLQLRLDGRVSLRLLRGMSLDSVRVREVGVRLESPRLRVDLGRARVFRGGHRLVDGVQLLARPIKGLQIGAWGGLLPDPWDTLPALRYGGGPILSVAGARGRFSAVGEVAGSADGLDRAGVLLLGGLDLGRPLAVDVRLDLQAPSVRGQQPLADGAIFLSTSPSTSLRISGFYEAYSSWRYLKTEDRDPKVRRFAQRSDALGLTEDIPQDSWDESLHHLFGAGVAWRPREPATRVRPEMSLRVRYRYHVEATRRMFRVVARGAAVGIGHDRLKLGLEGSLLVLQEGPREEIGVTARLEPDKGRWLSLDGSLRVSAGKNRPDGSVVPGLYADLFADLLLPKGLLVSAGYRFDYASAIGTPSSAHAAIFRLAWSTRVRAR